MNEGDRSAWDRYAIEIFSRTTAAVCVMRTLFDVRVGGCIKSQELVDLLGL